MIPAPANPPPASAASALVFAGGDPLALPDHRRLRDSVAIVGEPEPLVIAADSGLHVAHAGGWVADVVIGDLDSVDPEQLARAEAAGARVDRHPAAKAATDLELAIGAAVAAGVDRVVVVGGHGGRLDHLLANVALLGSDRFADVSIEAVLGPAWIHIVRRAATWSGGRGDLVTLLAQHGPVADVTTVGLLYPLDRATLHAGSTRGVSNEQLGPTAGVTVGSGVLAVIRPGETGTHIFAADAAGAPTGDDR